MNARIVTCIGPGNWDAYGKTFVETFLKSWPGADLHVWFHDTPLPAEKPDGVFFHDLMEVPQFRHLKSILRGDSGPTLRYSFKAIALMESVEPDVQWIAFVDADTEWFYPVDEAFMREMFDPEYDLTYLLRNFGQSEGSWFAFNLTSHQGFNLLVDYYGLYVSGEFLHYKNPTDNTVLDRITTIHRAHGLRVKNLSEGALGLDAWHQSPLAAYAAHFKGPDKSRISDPGLGVPGRYNLLMQLLEGVAAQHDPERQFIVAETGTWNGSRAVQMLQTLADAGLRNLHYIGFDTFEDGNDRTLEQNAKIFTPFDRVWRRLDIFSKIMSRKGVNITFELCRGDTRETLRDRQIVADFAYIDGGHSEETCRADFAAFRDTCPYIVLDDVIAEPEENAPPGPRLIFETAEGFQKRRFSTEDRYANLRQTISLGLLVRDGWPIPPIKISPIIVPKASVEKDDQEKIIQQNLQRISKWVCPIQAHEKRALLVSAGPTLYDFLPEIAKRQQAGDIVFAVKHAVPKLAAAGITPNFVTLLDPRPVNALSTHGEKRANLLAWIKPPTIALVASMSNPDVLNVLEAQGVEVWGWHAHSENISYSDTNKGLVVMGGTCAALRQHTLAFMLGFRRLTFYGYDFFYPEGIDQSRLDQKLMTVKVGQSERVWLTTGELMAAINDMNVWIEWMRRNHLTVEFRGDGIGALLWNESGPSTPPAEWNDVMGAYSR